MNCWTNGEVVDGQAELSVEWRLIPVGQKSGLEICGMRFYPQRAYTSFWAEGISVLKVDEAISERSRQHRMTLKLLLNDYGHTQVPDSYNKVRKRINGLKKSGRIEKMSAGEIKAEIQGCLNERKQERGAMQARSPFRMSKRSERSNEAGT